MCRSHFNASPVLTIRCHSDVAVYLEHGVNETTGVFGGWEANSFDRVKPYIVFTAQMTACVDMDYG